MAMPGGRMSAWGLARRRRRLEEPDVPARRVRRRMSQRVYNPLRMPAFPSYFGGQPKRQFAKLKYVEHFHTPGPGAGAIVLREYRANSCYDPRYAVGGDQPYGFDQIMDHYHHFTVLKSTCTVNLQSTLVTKDVLWVTSVYQEAGAPSAAYAAGGANALREIPIQSKDVISTSFQYRQRDRSTTTVLCNCVKIFNKSPESMIGNTAYSGDSTANPAEDVYFGITGYHPNGEDQSGTNFDLMITIVYYVVFSEPKWFTSS